VTRLAKVFLLYFVVGAAIAGVVMLWPLVLAVALLFAGIGGRRGHWSAAVQAPATGDAVPSVLTAR